MYWSQGLSDDLMLFYVIILSLVVLIQVQSRYYGARDLGGFDLTASALGYFMKDDWIGLENQINAKNGGAAKC